MKKGKAKRKKAVSKPRSVDKRLRGKPASSVPSSPQDAGQLQHDVVIKDGKGFRLAAEEECLRKLQEVISDNSKSELRRDMKEYFRLMDRLIELLSEVDALLVEMEKVKSRIMDLEAADKKDPGRSAG